MAAPNLQAPTVINGKLAYVALSSTTEATLLTNAANSGKLLTVTSLTLCNTTTSGPADCTVRIYSAATGGTGYAFPALTVSQGNAVLPIGKENPFNLEEDRRLTVQASAGNYITVFCNYEDAS
jgi:hypothetical protein